MLKNKSKVFVAILAILLMLSTFSFATDTPVTTSADGINPISTAPGDNTKTTGEEDAATETADIYNGDLYLSDNDVVMDRLVDGNVYLLGNNITISGKVNGNLFAMGNHVTFEKGSYVVQSAYIAAFTIDYAGNAGDFYAASNAINVAYDGFTIRDFRTLSNTLTLNGGVGRDAFITAKDFNFITEQGKAGIIYGDLEYSSEKELSLSNTFVQGDINYSNYSISSQPTIQHTIYNYVTAFLGTLIFALVIYLLSLVIAPKFNQNSASYVSKKILPAIGIGLLGMLLLPIISLMFIIIPTTALVGLAILAIFCMLMAISLPIVSIVITNKLKEKFGFTKMYQTLLTLVGTVLVLWALPYLPFVGWIISLAIFAYAIGIIFMSLFMKNDKSKKEEKKAQTDVKNNEEK